MRQYGLNAVPAGYADWRTELKQRIHAAQQRATLAVNRELILLNRPDNRGGYLVKVKYPSMSYYPGFVGSFLQPELEEYTR